jgi:anionic cell wall polymer biosynthesis LytR-Cps2A-Psr (LCP) family protein
MKSVPKRMAVLLLALVLLLASCSRRGSEADPDEKGKSAAELIADKHARAADVVVDGVPYAKKKDLAVYLMMGIDKSGDLETTRQTIGGQCDVLLLLVLNGEDKRQTVLQIDRDTMTEVELLDAKGNRIGNGIVQTQQICFAHTYGTGDEKSCENAVRAVSGLLGLYGDLEIDGYMALLYEAIPGLNDTVGGIRVKVEDDFPSDPTLVKGEEVELVGQHALNFVRGRMSVADGTNANRMKRQRAYLNAFGDRVKEEMHGNSGIINELYETAGPYMVTDITSGALVSIAATAFSCDNGGIVTIGGETKYVVYANGNTYAEFYPDENDLSEKILSLFYTRID